MKYALFFLSLSFGNYTMAQEISQTILKHINATEYKSDPFNGDGVFLAKGKKNSLWGMYQAFSEKNIVELIPMDYDSIDFFKYNAPFTGVWSNGKVGIYVSPWSFEVGYASTECVYDDFKPYYFSGKNTTYLAVKKNGLWAWIDWLTGVEQTKFIYDLNNSEMPYPLYQQTNLAIYPLQESLKNQPVNNYKKKSDKDRKKWGLVFTDENAKKSTVIPEEFDAVDFFDDSGTVAGAYKKGKVGLFIPLGILENNQTVPCEYDDYKVFYIFSPHPEGGDSYIGTPYVAVRKKGMWAWINHLTGEVMTDFNYDMVKKQLPYPQFKVNYPKL